MRHLMRRGNYYYARFGLTKEDQSKLGRKEIWRSLKVGTLREAVEKLSQIHYQFLTDKAGLMRNAKEYLDAEAMLTPLQTMGTGHTQERCTDLDGWFNMVQLPPEVSELLTV
jgi:hypothetical protein